MGTRPDDRPDVVRRRLRLYRREIAPVVDYYRARRLLQEVDGVGTEAEVFLRLLRAIAAAIYHPVALPLPLLARSQ